jgi:hypothetical protein
MQESLTYRTNRDLFSNHYLDEHLPETEAWDAIDDEEIPLGDALEELAVDIDVDSVEAVRDVRERV